MIRKPNNLYLLLSAIAFLSIGFIFQHSYYRSQNPRIDARSIQKVIQKKEIAVNELTQKIKGYLKNGSCTDLFSTCSGKFDHQLDKKGLAVYVYENDSLKYWSDNSLTVGTTYSGSGLNKNVVCLKNAWALVSRIKEGNRVIAGLVLLKRDYSYENEFLENRFLDEFNLPQNVEISQVPVKKGISIYGDNKEFLFSLSTVFKVPSQNEQAFFSAFFYLIALVCLALFVFNLLMSFFTIGVSLALFFVILAFTRFIMIQFHIPAIFYALEMFGPHFYAVSSWLPSLGELFVSAVFLFIFSLLFFRKVPIRGGITVSATGLGYLAPVISVVAIEACFLLIHYLLGSIVFNSNISLEVYKVLSISPYSVVNFFVIAMLFASFLLITDHLIHLISGHISWSGFTFLFLGLTAVNYGICFLLGYHFDFYSLLFLIIIVMVIVFSRFRNTQGINYTTLILVVFIVSLYATIFILNASIEKERNVRKVLVVGLANERDPIAELLFPDFESQLLSDKVIKKYLLAPVVAKKDIYKHIVDRYFQGFLNKYDLRVTVCGSLDSLKIVQTNELYKCHDFFDDMIQQRGFAIPNTNFYFIDNVNGRINYLGVIKFTEGSREIALFMELNSKLVTEELGYPELLLENKFKKPANLSEYSYAKYRGNELIAQSGVFSYRMSGTAFGNSRSEFSFINLDSYNHLVYNIDRENKIVISIPVMSSFDGLISFCYIFVFFILLVMLAFFMRYSPVKFKRYRQDFKYRIRFVMVSVLLLSLFFIGGGTVYYNLKQYERNHYQNISEKAQSVTEELDQKLSGEKALTPDMQDYLTELLIQLSNVFYSDMNLYGPDGYLLASSRPEVFKKGLISTRMNVEAYREMAINKKSEYIHSEKIDKLSYLSAYVPYYNDDNRLLAYLNLPYFTKQSALKKEISTFIVAIINIYILLILFTIAITLVIANNITRPLSLIRSKLSEIEFGKKNEPIVYSSDDEIGNLVREYNRMLDELTKSAEMLAKSERESAWREMAKQIAHEIKNPLTPMKLGIQHLRISWNDKAPDWETRFNKCTQTLIEQIDTLSAIATEFSNFASLPKDHNEVVELAEKIKSSVALFEETENIRIITDFHHLEHVRVFADKEQLTRVFNNLLKNAVQSIPGDREGLITIEMTADPGKVVVSIADNGIGISKEVQEKLFVPNFTTKSSGMGLGLAMVKNIVENAAGRIWFKTELNRGTIFFVEFAVYKENM